jgi:hypothetical protein
MFQFTPLSSSSFTTLVIFVVLVCSKKQVVKIDTRWVVTVMEYAKSIWNLSKLELPDKPCGCDKLIANFYFPITADVARCPYPTPPMYWVNRTIFGINLIPKSFNRWINDRVICSTRPFPPHVVHLTPTSSRTIARTVTITSINRTLNVYPDFPRHDSLPKRPYKSAWQVGRVPTLRLAKT